MTARITYLPGVVPPAGAEGVDEFPDASAPAPGQTAGDRQLAGPQLAGPQLPGPQPDDEMAPWQRGAERKESDQTAPWQKSAEQRGAELRGAEYRGAEHDGAEDGGATQKSADALSALSAIVTAPDRAASVVRGGRSARDLAAERASRAAHPTGAATRERPHLEVVGSDIGEDDDLDEEPAMSEGERSAFLENIVARALSRKALSEWEITKLLAENGVEESEYEIFLDRYRDNRYIDDLDLAETLVESLHRRKGLGRSQIKHELATRHIQPEIIAQALDALDDDDELQRAIALAEKRAPSLARLDAQTAERRLSSFLMRKGYPSAVIRAAVETALKPQPRGVRFR